MREDRWNLRVLSIRSPDKRHNACNVEYDGPNTNQYIALCNGPRAYQVSHMAGIASKTQTFHRMAVFVLFASCELLLCRELLFHE